MEWKGRAPTHLNESYQVILKTSLDLIIKEPEPAPIPVPAGLEQQRHWLTEAFSVLIFAGYATIGR